MKWLGIFGPLLLLAGCGLTQTQRDDLVRVIADKAGEKAADLVLKEAGKLGLSDDAARELADLAAAKATEAAGKEADKRLPPAEEGGGVGGILAVLLNLGLTLAGKGGK